MAVLNPYNYAKPRGVIAQRNNSAIKEKTISDRKNKHKNNGDKYLEQKVLSASPEELTLMLYEGAVRFIKQALMYNEEKNIEKTSNAIMRVQAIYAELRSTLNMDYDISEELDKLYDYVNYRLVEANISKNNEMLNEVLNMTEEFRDTWKAAMELAKG